MTVIKLKIKRKKNEFDLGKKNFNHKKTKQTTTYLNQDKNVSEQNK